MTAFLEAADVLFTDPNLSDTAQWVSCETGAHQTVRIVRKRPDQMIGFGTSRAVMATVLIDVRRSDVAMPAIDDVVIVGSAVYTIIAEPVGDTLGLVWTCEASV